MSASDKKKLRKELNAAALTEKQQKEAKEAKKLKTYTISFVVVMVLIVAIIAGVTLRTPVAGMIDRNTVAVTVGTHKLSTTEFSYFYVDAIDNFYSTYNQYAQQFGATFQQMTGLNPSLPLNTQVYSTETGMTWDTYFIDAAKSTAKQTYAMYDAAMKANYQLSAEETKSLESTEANLSIAAMYTGYSSVDSYLRNIYGDGANLKTYLEYTKVNTIASSYATYYYNSLTYTDAQFRDFEKDKLAEYNSYSYALYRLSADSYKTFLGLGTTTKGEDGKETTTYTAEEEQKALDAALADAKLLIAAGITDVEKFNEELNKLAINLPKTEDEPEDETEGETEGETEDKTEGETEGETEDTTETEKEYNVTATEGNNVLYSNVLSNTNTDAHKWLTDAARKAGEMQYVEISTGEGDSKKVTGYFVLLYLGTDDNKYHTSDVQHILIKFEGGKKDAQGNTIYSQTEKDAAKAKAEKILAGFKTEAKQDSAVFGVLAKENSEDTGSKDNNGLYSGINKGSNYVKPFLDWAMADHEVGDTGIIETEYGYHIMFYTAKSELTYRDQMIKAELLEKDYKAWSEGLVKAMTVTDGNLKGIKRDLIIGG